MSDTIDYRLGRTGSGAYPQLHSVSDTTIGRLNMYPSGDALDFFKRRGEHTFGAHWTLPHVDISRETYHRLHEVPDYIVGTLASRMSHFLHGNNSGIEQLLKELTVLRETQSELIENGEIILPEPLHPLLRA